MAAEGLESTKRKKEGKKKEGREGGREHNRASGRQCTIVCLCARVDQSARRRRSVRPSAQINTLILKRKREEGARAHVV